MLDMDVVEGERVKQKVVLKIPTFKLEIYKSICVVVNICCVVYCCVAVS